MYLLVQRAFVRPVDEEVKRLRLLACVSGEAVGDETTFAENEELTRCSMALLPVIYEHKFPFASFLGPNVPDEALGKLGNFEHFDRRVMLTCQDEHIFRKAVEN